MATLTAEYLDDIGRVRLTAGSLLANVGYTLQRSTTFEPTWVDVRGGGFVSATGTTIVDDYEYTPNTENFYRLIAPTVSDAFEREIGPGGLVLTGDSGAHASTPDAASLDITGNIDIRAVIVFDSYATGGNQTITAKYVTTGNQRSYWLRVGPSGNLQLIFSTNGTGSSTVTSTITLYSAGAADGDLTAVRVTREATNGFVTFYVGSDPVMNPDTWIPVGNVIDGLNGNLFVSTAPLEVGSVNNGTGDRATGTVVSVQVRNGIDGTLAAFPNFSSQATGTANFVDPQGNTWTVNGTAAIAGNDQAWGSTDTGQLWNLHVDSAVDGVWEVKSGFGRAVVPESSFNVYGRYLNVNLADIDARYDIEMPDLSAAANDQAEFRLLLRGTNDLSDGYQAVLSIDASTSGAALTLSGAGTVDPVPLPNWQPGQIWRIAARTVGDVITAKAWNTENHEPGTWQLSTTSTNWTSGTIGIVLGPLTNESVDTRFDNLIVFDEPVSAAASASITPVQLDVWLKSVTYPLFNQALDCVNWDALSRTSRAGFFDIKGRHEILAITDVGSSASFTLSLLTRSRAENRALVALLTYGGVLYLQPPGDVDEACSIDFSGIPGGYVVPSGSVQNHSLPGRALWGWEVEFTRVAPSDADGINPTTITWEQLWAIIGPEGTWEDVWATWPTWQALWQTTGNPSDFNGGVIG